MTLLTAVDSRTSETQTLYIKYILKHKKYSSSLRCCLIIRLIMNKYHRFHLIPVNLQKLHKSLTGIMSFLYISILLFAACVDSEDTPITVSARVGSTVILPCKLTEVFNQTSLIQWKMNNELVIERRINATRSGSGYEGRVDIPVDKLRKGNCSLVLKDVRKTEDRFYKTFTVEHVDSTNPTEAKVFTSVRLSVYETQVSARVGSTAVLPCEWKNVSIQTFHVEWYVDSEIVFERNGEESFEGAGYGGRLDVPKDDLLKGNCSLVLKNVSVTDAVIYRSAMVLPETKKSVLVQTVKLSIDGEAGINCPCPLILIISFLMYLFFSH